MNTPSSDHRKGCQCQTCVSPEPPARPVYELTGHLERFARDLRRESALWPPNERAQQVARMLNSYAERLEQLASEATATDHADAAQGGVTTNPDGSITYLDVPIVEEKPRGK